MWLAAWCLLVKAADEEELSVFFGDFVSVSSSVEEPGILISLREGNRAWIQFSSLEWNKIKKLNTIKT